MKKGKLLPRTITRKWLNSHEACEEHVELFEKVWPDGTVITQEAISKAAKEGLNLEWFAQHVLSETVYASYEAEVVPLSDDYLTQRASLSAEYEAKRDLLYADYAAKHDSLDIKYVTKDTLFYEYKTRRISFRDEYRAARTVLYTDYHTTVMLLLVALLWATYEKEADHDEEGQTPATYDHSRVAECLQSL